MLTLEATEGSITDIDIVSGTFKYSITTTVDKTVTITLKKDSNVQKSVTFNICNALQEISDWTAPEDPQYYYIQEIDEASSVEIKNPFQPLGACYTYGLFDETGT